MTFSFVVRPIFLSDVQGRRVMKRFLFVVLILVFVQSLFAFPFFKSKKKNQEASDKTNIAAEKSLVDSFSDVNFSKLPCNILISVVQPFRDEGKQDDAAFEEALNQIEMFLLTTEFQAAYKLNKINTASFVETDYKYSVGNGSQRETWKEKCKILGKKENLFGGWIYFIEFDGLPKVTRQEYFNLDPMIFEWSKKSGQVPVWLKYQKEPLPSGEFNFSIGYKKRDRNFSKTIVESFMNGICEIVKDRNTQIVNFEASKHIMTQNSGRTDKSDLMVSYSSANLTNLFVVDRFIDTDGTVFTLTACRR